MDKTATPIRLKLETNPKQLYHRDPLPNIRITPAITPEFWLWRVVVSDSQAIVAFPKFGVVGIGFQIEKADWNTNLPSECKAWAIYKHIKANKGDPSIPAGVCVAAIKMIQRAIRKSQASKA